MSVTVIYQGKEQAHQLTLGLNWLVGLVLAFMMLLLALLWHGYDHFSTRLMAAEASRIQVMAETRHELEQAYEEKTQQRLQQMAQQIGLLRAQLARLNAYGRQIADTASIDSELDLNAPIPMGGPEMEPIQLPPLALPALSAEVDQLNQSLYLQEKQLSVLEPVLVRHHINDQVYPSGHPVPGEDAWISSTYGKRTDPFTGFATMHRGIDVASSEGREVVSTGAGVVSWAGYRTGYGGFVEVVHDGNFVTRYGHNKEVLVRVGEVVRKGQVLARMGSTGRSTGPHVHYEVLHQGRQVNPLKYIDR